MSVKGFEINLDDNPGAQKLFDTILDRISGIGKKAPPAHGLTHDRGPFKADSSGIVKDRNGKPVCYCEDVEAVGQRIAACLNACCGLEGKALFPHIVIFMLEQALTVMSPMTAKMVRERLADIAEAWEKDGSAAQHP